MFFKDDSHKSEANRKSAGSARSESSRAHSKHSPAQGSQHSHRSKNAQSAQPAASAHRNFQASDIRSLVQHHGRAELSGQEWTLKAPSWNDSSLQAIISDPHFTAKATGRSAVDGKLTYQLSGHGKTINVTIGH